MAPTTVGILDAPGAGPALSGTTPSTKSNVPSRYERVQRRAVGLLAAGCFSGLCGCNVPYLVRQARVDFAGGDYAQALSNLDAAEIEEPVAWPTRYRALKATYTEAFVAAELRRATTLLEAGDGRAAFGALLRLRQQIEARGAGADALPEVERGLEAAAEAVWRELDASAVPGRFEAPVHELEVVVGQLRADSAMRARLDALRARAAEWHRIRAREAEGLSGAQWFHEAAALRFGADNEPEVERAKAATLRRSDPDWRPSVSVAPASASPSVSKSAVSDGYSLATGGDCGFLRDRLAGRFPPNPGQVAVQLDIQVTSCVPVRKEHYRNDTRLRSSTWNEYATHTETVRTGVNTSSYTGGHYNYATYEVTTVTPHVTTWSENVSVHLGTLYGFDVAGAVRAKWGGGSGFRPIDGVVTDWKARDAADWASAESALLASLHAWTRQATAELRAQQGAAELAALERARAAGDRLGADDAAVAHLDDPLAASWMADTYGLGVDQVRAYLEFARLRRERGDRWRSERDRDMARTLDTSPPAQWLLLPPPDLRVLEEWGELHPVLEASRTRGVATVRESNLELAWVVRQPAQDAGSLASGLRWGMTTRTSATSSVRWSAELVDPTFGGAVRGLALDAGGVFGDPDADKPVLFALELEASGERVVGGDVVASIAPAVGLIVPTGRLGSIDGAFHGNLLAISSGPGFVWFDLGATLMPTTRLFLRGGAAWYLGAPPGPRFQAVAGVRL